MKVDIKKLKKEQYRLAKKIILKDSFEDIKLIGGCDQAFYDNKVISMIIVIDIEIGKIIERKYAVKEIRVPYIPGFLAYREMPCIIDAFNKLENKPDILMCDCNGILHPRKIGMASHLGLLLEIPTIGVAKKKLLGIVDENKKIIYDDQVLGVEIITKEHAKPIYVSPGHMISFKTCEKIAKQWLKGHKLPEPLHLAHKFANSVKKKLKEDSVEKKEDKEEVIEEEITNKEENNKETIEKTQEEEQ